MSLPPTIHQNDWNQQSMFWSFLSSSSWFPIIKCRVSQCFCQVILCDPKLPKHQLNKFSFQLTPWNWTWIFILPSIILGYPFIKCCHSLNVGGLVEVPVLNNKHSRKIPKNGSLFGPFQFWATFASVALGRGCWESLSIFGLVKNGRWRVKKRHPPGYPIGVSPRKVSIKWHLLKTHLFLLSLDFINNKNYKHVIIAGFLKGFLVRLSPKRLVKSWHLLTIKKDMFFNQMGGDYLTQLP